MIGSIFLAIVSAIFGRPLAVAASAEWCERDDFMLHDVVDGKHLAIHVKVQQLSPKSALKDWSAAGNIRLAESGTGRVRIVGPGYEWRATVYANHAYVQLQPNDRVYDAGATVVIDLTATQGA